MSFQSSLEELAPETVLEQVNQAINVEDLLYVLRNVILHFVQAVRKAEANDETKTKVIFYLGEFYEAFFMLSRAFSEIVTLRLRGLPEEYFYSHAKDRIAALIHMYADVKNGKPLEDVANRLTKELASLDELADNYNVFVYSAFRDLLEELRKIVTSV